MNIFKSNKYGKCYINIIRKALSENRNKKDEYLESHHIIPLCMGGKQTVLLTAKEHFICHLLLPFFTYGQNRYKMINAINAMKRMSNGQKRYTSKNYLLVKRLNAERNSAIMKGVPKSDEARKNMKGRSGTWKRSEEHKKKLKEIRKKHALCGDKNPAKRPEVRKKISEAKMGNKCGIGNKSTTGKIWVNNGVERRMVDPKEIPPGFKKGQKYAMA